MSDENSSSSSYESLAFARLMELTFGGNYQFSLMELDTLTNTFSYVNYGEPTFFSSRLSKKPLFLYNNHDNSKILNVRDFEFLSNPISKFTLLTLGSFYFPRIPTLVKVLNKKIRVYKYSGKKDKFCGELCWQECLFTSEYHFWDQTLTKRG